MNQAVNLTAQRIGQAGRGKLVLAHGSVAVTFNKLLEQAKRGNYWATFIVREIEQLTAGVNNSKQVYTHEKLRAGGYANYRMVLPGCSATIVCTPSGEYNIYALEVDFDYFQKQEEAKKPGLHFVRKGREDMWTSSFLSQKEVADNGKKMRQPGFVKAQSANKMDWIIAGVADLNHTPAEAAKEVVTHIAASPYNYPNLSELGFNLMFTPGKGSIGGLFHPREAFNATKSERLNESATILADAMIKAQKKRQKVAWISQLGGSGVLTQALKICKDRNVKLNMQAAYLANPTTSSDPAHKD
ncbi:hypothetical protein [Hahella sp. HN01]|uniref:hypothetical protein n=1 Tax=Hahella sp. HN01 TaxID=2847262 RepID=UPI001C1ECDDC|nr:hypothetical protein [Hahella sp. HN01]MBU6954842.1 hypothetical protein [Hahella sp. HN01]